jgi:hypothetical protein
MKSPHLAAINPRNSQRGVAAVEFALAGIVFFLLLLGAMEFGRLLYVWNTVQEVTRNATRQAVVTDFTKADEIVAIQRSAVFRIDAGHLPASPEITHAEVVIRYLNADENVVDVSSGDPSSPGDNIAACIDASRVAKCIRFVEVCVGTAKETETCKDAQPIGYVPMISLFSKGSQISFGNLTIPLSTVRMPAESLGFRPSM